ncbi:MAG: VWA domain-containing protein [Acidobacteriaceae bacterium]|nr:VWA domain-containing protein [Acidobacteriaceae bacterium]
MSFAHGRVLLLLPLALAWAVYEWRSGARRLALILKALSFAAIAVAFAEPRISLPRTRTGVVVLVDTSASITRNDLARASSFVSEVRRRKGGNWMNVVPFASQTRTLTKAEWAGGLHLTPASGEMANGTNLEFALVNTMGAIPAGYIPRLVLLTDGNENEGSSARAIAELRQLQVPVDTVPLAGRPNAGVRLEALSMPREAYAGEQIPIDLVIYSPRAVRASVDLSAEEKNLGSNPVDLEAGLNTVRVHARLKASGATFISGKVTAGALGEASFEQAVQLKKAKILYLSQDPPGTEQNLLQAFGEAEFEVTREVSLIDKGLDSIQLVILNNLDLNSLAIERKSRLEEYVKGGGGLLLIGGERQVYKQDQQMDALDRALPAKLAPPKTPEGTCVALIIDKSSSMEGRKIELARLSAVGVVDHLRPTDSIGVLIFDNSYQWAVPMRRAQDTALIKRLISGITPDGGTQIAPALAEAYRKVSRSKANYKHIVLLTDGISEEGDSFDLAKEAKAHQVTISTVGLGQDVNRSYLEKIAETSGGRSYFLNEPQGLEQILLKDVEDYSGSSAVEKPLTPIVERPAEILQNVGMESAPALKGYARYDAKLTAETILGIDPERKDPLYVRWRYGLGRAGVFASDAKSRWAEAWVTWPGFDKFWMNVTRDLLGEVNRSEASAQFDAADGDLTVTYRLAPGSLQPASVPPIYILGPNAFRKAIDISKIEPQVYRGRVHVGRARGLFRIRPVIDTPTFPEIGFYRQEEELRDHGSNEALLQQISALTGGRFNPSPESVFEADGRSIYTTWQLWPALLGLAIALTVAELITRKWSGITQAFRRR